jgi:hypothetical protein
VQHKFKIAGSGLIQFGLMSVLLLGGAMVGSTANASAVLLQEVLYDGEGSDSDDVFTELYGTPGLLLDGWSLVGVNGGNAEAYRSIDLSGGVIAADGIFVVATASANAELAMLTDFIGNVDWQNGPDAVQLWFGDMLMDSLQYGDAGINNAGEGNVAALVMAGQSLSRNLLGTDTNNNALDFSAGVPSAGVGPAAVPVPAAAWLMLSALGVLGIQRRSRLNSA